MDIEQLSRRISPAQKKLFGISLIIFLTALNFWYFIYLPNRNRVGRFKSRLHLLRQQIEDIESLVDKEKTVAENMQLLFARYNELNDRFPQNEKEGLERLAQLSRTMNIDLVSIKPHPKQVFRAKDNKPLEIKGRLCYSLFVSLEIKCRYEDLVKFLEAVEAGLPAYATVENLTVNRIRSGSPRLKATLGINLYLLS